MIALRFQEQTRSRRSVSLVLLFSRNCVDAWDCPKRNDVVIPRVPPMLPAPSCYDVYGVSTFAGSILFTHWAPGWGFSFVCRNWAVTGDKVFEIEMRQSSLAIAVQ